MADAVGTFETQYFVETKLCNIGKEGPAVFFVVPSLAPKDRLVNYRVVMDPVLDEFRVTLKPKVCLDAHGSNPHLYGETKIIIQSLPKLVSTLGHKGMHIAAQTCKVDDAMEIRKSAKSNGSSTADTPIDVDTPPILLPTIEADKLSMVEKLTTIEEEPSNKHHLDKPNQVNESTVVDKLPKLDEISKLSEPTLLDEQIEDDGPAKIANPAKARELMQANEPAQADMPSWVGEQVDTNSSCKVEELFNLTEFKKIEQEASIDKDKDVITSSLFDMEHEPLNKSFPHDNCIVGVDFISNERDEAAFRTTSRLENQTDIKVAEIHPYNQSSSSSPSLPKEKTTSPEDSAPWTLKPIPSMKVEEAAKCDQQKSLVRYSKLRVVFPEASRSFQEAIISSSLPVSPSKSSKTSAESSPPNQRVSKSPDDGIKSFPTSSSEEETISPIATFKGSRELKDRDSPGIKDLDDANPSHLDASTETFDKALAAQEALELYQSEPSANEHIPSLAKTNVSAPQTSADRDICDTSIHDIAIETNETNHSLVKDGQEVSITPASLEMMHRYKSEIAKLEAVPQSTLADDARAVEEETKTPLEVDHKSSAVEESTFILPTDNRSNDCRKSRDHQNTDMVAPHDSITAEIESQSRIEDDTDPDSVIMVDDFAKLDTATQIPTDLSSGDSLGAFLSENSSDEVEEDLMNGREEFYNAHCLLLPEETSWILEWMESTTAGKAILVEPQAWYPDTNWPEDENRMTETVNLGKQILHLESRNLEDQHDGSLLNNFSLDGKHFYETVTEFTLSGESLSDEVLPHETLGNDKASIIDIDRNKQVPITVPAESEENLWLSCIVIAIVWFVGIFMM